MFPFQKEETTCTGWVPGWAGVPSGGWHRASLCPRDVASVQLIITTCPTVHTPTQQHLMKKYICTFILCFFFFLVLHKLEATFGEKAWVLVQAAGLEMQSGPAVPSPLPPWALPGQVKLHNVPVVPQLVPR